MMQGLSVIIPVLDEAAAIVPALDRLQTLRAAGVQIVVADGGSTDGTAELARPFADVLVFCRRGRARQMNAGASAASGDVLLFLHADTCLPADAAPAIAKAIAGSHEWGRFDVRIAGAAAMLKVVAACMNVRSRLSGIATGDQAIFVTRAAFDALGGYADIALMEDIALSAALRRRGRPACLPGPVVTSGRRWESGGVWRTIFRMWGLRLRNFLGANPSQLARDYGYRIDE